jgi:quercetin dioxygenase-like cupin family protein
MNPYFDKNLNTREFFRSFSKDVLSEELVWHRDRNNRIVTVLEGEGWEIQFDEELPRKMVVGERFEIPAYTFHRIKRGKTDLKLKIKEV